MDTVLNEYEKITQEAKTQIESIPIVFPAKYGKIFYEIARSQNVELSPEELIIGEMVDEKIIRHLISLTSYTDQAITAIEREDKENLQAVLSEIKSLREESRELQKLVYEDCLTKSFNRKWFADTFIERDNIALRNSGTIVIIDLNDFKGINDTYGHIIGDKVLVHIAMKLKESGGRVVRYGGDEFLVIFDITIAEAKIREKMDGILSYFQKVHFRFEEKQFKTSFSYGLAPFDTGSSINDILDTADKAMYQHKRAMKH